MLVKDEDADADSSAPLSHNLCDVGEPEIHGDMVAGNGLLIKVRDFITREQIRRAEKDVKPRDLYFFFTFLAVLAHVIVISCTPVLLWLLITRYKCAENHYVCKYNYHVWFTGPVAATASVIGISYIYILLESGLSRTWKYIKNRRLCSIAEEYVHRRRHRLPVIYVQVNCFHFKTDRNLNVRQVITHSEKVRFQYVQCIDVSGDLNMPEKRSDRPTKVELQYIFGFVDRETEQKFKYFKTSLVEQHSAKDRNIEILELIEMEGIEQKLCVISQAGTPRWTHPVFYWLSSIFLFTFLYRCLFIKRTDNKLFLYIKLIKA